MSAIEVRNLSKRFGPVTAVDDLSFSVEAGTITGFVGPNGAGKSTTLRMLLGLVRPSSGEALIDGRPYWKLDAPGHRVGAVLEASDFHPGRRAVDHLRVHASALRADRARVDQVLAEVDLSEAAHRRVGGFSLGMRQRLGLATALLGDPPILVLDEPANGLDPEGVRWLRGFLRARATAGGTVLLSSHLLAELALAADHVVVIKAGRLVTASSVAALTAGRAHSVRLRTPTTQRLREVLTERGVQVDDAGGDEIVARGITAEQAGEIVAAAGLVVYEMRPEQLELEDAVLDLTRPEA